MNAHRSALLMILSGAAIAVGCILANDAGAATDTSGRCSLAPFTSCADPFADSVVAHQVHGAKNTHLDPSTVVGPPCKGSGADLSLGGGWVIVDMGAGEKIIDRDGTDLVVYESESSPYCNGGAASPYEVFVSDSSDGPWISVGSGSGVAEFDLSPSGLESARYVKVEDRSSGQPDDGSPTPGADIAGFSALHPNDYELAERFAPYLYGHVEEIYWPVPIDAPVKASDLHYWHWLLPYTLPNPRPDQLAEEPYNGSNSYLDFPGDGKEGMADAFNAVKEEPEWQPKTYARVKRDNPNEDIIIQYWFFYYDNPSVDLTDRTGIDDAVIEFFNHHEGDWEMIQVVLNKEEIPKYAVYSQHGWETRRLWSEVKKGDGDGGSHPAVYVASGSHASYFGPYRFWLDSTGNEVMRASQPASLIMLHDDKDSPGFDTWLDYEGYWGKRNLDRIPWNDGPKGPAQKGEKWDAPWSWGEEAQWDELCGFLARESCFKNNFFKFQVAAPMPLDVHVIEIPSMDHVGWKDGGEETEIYGSEYFDNSIARIRTIILHDTSRVPPYPLSNYLVLLTLRWSEAKTSAMAVSDSMTVTLRFPDPIDSSVITSTYVLTRTWEVSSTGVISVFHDSDLHLMLDIDGDGGHEQDLPPSKLEETYLDFTAPAPITDLRVLTSTVNATTLTWTAPGDDGSIGRAIAYDIRFYKDPITEANWASATQIVPPIPSEAGTAELFTMQAMPGGHHYFAVRSIDDMLYDSGLSNVVDVDIPHRLFLPVVLRVH